MLILIQYILGDRRSLEYFVEVISSSDLSNIHNNLKAYYSFLTNIKGKPKQNFIDNRISKREVFTEEKPVQVFDNELTSIDKYGTLVQFKPSEHIRLVNNRFNFSKQFKEDIFNLSSEEMCAKYLIFPKQVICKIKSKLNYIKNHS